MFAVYRNEANRGVGVKSGMWLFEEFMFADSVFGSAVVRYDVNSTRLADSEVGEGDPARYRITLTNQRVTSVVVFDDDGNIVSDNESDDQQDLLKSMVLEAFADREDAVLEFERSLI